MSHEYRLRIPASANGWEADIVLTVHADDPEEAAEKVARVLERLVAESDKTSAEDELLPSSWK